MTTPYDHLPGRSFWRTGVANSPLLDSPGVYERKFAIDSRTLITSAGSCFAQHIGRALKARGFNYLDAEPPPPALPAVQRTAFGYEMFSARYGNVYTARQLLQLVQEAHGDFSPSEQVWIKDGRYFDPQRPSIEPDGFASEAELLAMRRSHLGCVRRLLRETELFIFTLGLTEAWLSEENGTVFGTCPGTVAGAYDPARHRFHNFSYEEVLADMLSFMKLARELQPEMKFLLTVSPVPLTATATDDHVLVATVYSKSVLRAVAGALTTRLPYVDYFPSYEIITTPSNGGVFYEQNMRTVKQAGVDHVMGHFFTEHTPPAPGRTPSVAIGQPASFDPSFAAVCDEERLDRAVSS